MGWMCEGPDYHDPDAFKCAECGAPLLPGDQWVCEPCAVKDAEASQ